VVGDVIKRRRHFDQEVLLLDAGKPQHERFFLRIVASHELAAHLDGRPAVRAGFLHLRQLTRERDQFVPFHGRQSNGIRD
jgi:hypothetical protein